MASGNAVIAGSVTAASFLGQVSGTLSANNVSAGAFGTNTGGGNYSFPANVGIGTTAPNTPLHVYGGVNMAGGWDRTAMLESDYPVLGFYSNYSPSYRKYAGIGYDVSTGMRFWVNAGTEDIAATTAVMSISNNGNVGIGTMSPGVALDVRGSAVFGDGNGGCCYTRLDINYIGAGTQYGVEFKPSADYTYPLIFLNAAGGLVGSVFTNDTGTAFNTGSDRRLKENIVSSELGLDLLGKISVRDFSFVSDAKKKKVQGFIAQELYDVYPYAVTEGGENPLTNPWSVDYGRLTPLIVKSVQQLDERSAEQAKTIKVLQAENDALTKRIEALEKKLGSTP
jgi:hypothetical protein